MRKGLAAGVAVLASLALGGCSGSAEQGGGAPPQAPPAPAKQARSGPAKSLNLPNNCSIVTQDQARQLGADQQPRERTSNGTPGCSYDQGSSGGGFLVFVAADKQHTMQQFADARRSSAKPTDVGGYPAVQVGTNATNCLVSVDVADQGSLYINTVVPHGTPQPCELSMQFAQAAVQNLPNA